MTTASIRGVELEGFKRYRELSGIALADRPAGLHLVRGENQLNIARMGSNGAGKSSLWDALCWCLYGRTVKGRPTSAVRPWQSTKQPRVAVALRRGQVDHVVQRGPRATQLTLNGKAVGQEEVEALVGLGHAEFVQAVVLGQGRPLFFDLRPAEKMQLLSDVLGLERWGRRADAARARAKKLEVQLAEVSGELRGVEASLVHAESALRDAQGAAGAWDEDRGRRVAELREGLSVASSALQGLEEREAEASLAADAAGLRLRGLRAEAGEAHNRLRQHERASESAQAKIAAARRDRARLEEQLKSLEEGTCPLCGQPVKKKDADKHRREMESEMSNLRGTISRLTTAREHEDAEAEHAAQVVAADRVQLEALEVEQREHQSVLRALSADLGAARGRASALSDKLTAAETEANPHHEAGRAAQRRIRELEKDESELHRRADKLEASTDRAKFWAQGFRDIRLMIIDDVLADLQETTAGMLEALGMGEWEVTYAAERETKSGTTQRALHVAVTSPESGEPRDWEDWSGGEGQRLRLAGALSLSEVLLAHAGVSVDIRVLDEPTRSLSAEGVRDLCELLAQYALDADLRLFYVDHTAQDGAYFASTTTVINDTSGARVAST